MKDERMAQTGETLHGLMRGVLHPLDLLVRESIQNSLDAARVKEKNEVVTVEFSTGEFDHTALCRAIGDEMGESLGICGKNWSTRYITIRDSGTVGLTGKVSDKSSNLCKLVYEVFQKQQGRGAGGSCGVGKTTYLEMGEGIVFYYSAVNTKDGQEHRLAGIIVEDPKSKQLIKGRQNRGIAFLGRYIDKKRASQKDKTGPITDLGEIEPFLSIFGLKPYGPAKSGTTVIIPYFKGERFLDQCRCRDGAGNPPAWACSVEDYIKTAVQRWYFPRLNNQSYNGPWLKVSINGKGLTKEGTAPIFRHLAAMYNASDELQDANYGINCEPITKKIVVGQNVGWMSWSALDPLKLGLSLDKYHDINSILGNYGDGTGTPVLVYMRKPGMAVKYVSMDSSWIPSGIQSSDRASLVVLFRLKSDSNLTSELVKKLEGLGKSDISTLEDYVRSCEREDHYDWTDIAGIDVISRIKEGVSKKLKDVCSPEQESFQNQTQRTISAKLTQALLPSPGVFGVNVKDRRSKAYSSARSPNSSLELDSVEYTRTGMEIDFGLKSAKSDSIRIFFTVRGESGEYDVEEWSKDVGSAFPLQVQTVSIVGVKGDHGKIFSKDTIELGKKSTLIVGGIVACRDDHGLVLEGCNGEKITGRMTVKVRGEPVSFNLKVVDER